MNRLELKLNLNKHLGKQFKRRIESALALLVDGEPAIKGYNDDGGIVSNFDRSYREVCEVLRDLLDEIEIRGVD